MLIRDCVTFSLVLGMGIGLGAQMAPKQVTAAQYAEAERYLGYNVDPLVLNAMEGAHWLKDGRFWYSASDAQGPNYVLVNPARATREPAFDRVAMARALSAISGRKVTVKTLRVTGLTFSPDGQSVTLSYRGKRYQCTRSGASCEPSNQPAPPNPFARFGAGGGTPGQPPLSVSPNGTLAVYIKNWNLWLRNMQTHQDTQLTFDGVENFGYATDNAGWTNSDRAIVLWSPDSTRIATYQQDQRGVGKLYLVPVVAGHPKLVTQVYPLPGDKVVTTIQRVVIDVAGPGAPKVVRLQMPPDQHRSTTKDDLAWSQHEDVQWNPEGTKLLFVSTSRGHKHEWVRLADAATGAVQTIFEDTVKTQYQGGQGGGTFRYLPKRGGFIWYSQKDAPPAPGMAGGTEAGLGQLYFYGLDGKAQHQITSPSNGNVDSVVYVDHKAGYVYYIATAVPGVNPYYQQLWRAPIAGGEPQRLTPENENHRISFAPGGKYFIDTYSTPDAPPISVLRTDTGKLLMRLTKADISRLVATGWKPPIMVAVKGRDHKTDIYGVMIPPFHPEPGRKFPIINYIYPGPQIGSVANWNFAAARGDDEALAQLGFVVVSLDGMGTPWRGEKFHDAYYGDMKDNTLPDQVIGMKELAQKFPYIDISKAGMWGHSGGGFATADAMFRYPNFFKVGVAESGNHDPLEYEDDWAERYQGLVTPTGVDHETTYTGQDNESAAKNLRGHLMLTVGTSDNNVPLNNTLLVVQALIKANKDFKLILYPNAHHGYATYSPYQMRQRWDFFVRYLAGEEPPHEFKMETPPPRF
ncbi:MAG: S9 family peptidase [Acidobacteria bacterium]|nr:MAG: S9 family peptidase [Acidobacteriota bacterium]